MIAFLFLENVFGWHPLHYNNFPALSPAQMARLQLSAWMGGKEEKD
jgi:hypothetical protein